MGEFWNHASNNRGHYGALAEAWTAAQAERLGLGADEITAAIERGWVASEIDSVTTTAELAGDPPPRDVFELRPVVK